MKAQGTVTPRKVPAWVIAKIKGAGGNATSRKKTSSTRAKHKNVSVRKTQLFAGNAPSVDDGWFPVGDCRSHDGVGWTIYWKPQPPHSEWATLKVSANGPAPYKANYWISYNFVANRIAKGKDISLMQNARPELHEAVMETLQDYAEKNCGK